MSSSWSGTRLPGSSPEATLDILDYVTALLRRFRSHNCSWKEYEPRSPRVFCQEQRLLLIELDDGSSDRISDEHEER
jgi:hypothetical protein